MKTCKSSSCPPLHIGATHQEIIEHYRRCKLPDLNSQLNWFASQRSFHAALRRAAVARSQSGGRFSHQWRLPRTAYPQALRLLVACQALHNCKTFVQLYAQIESVVGYVHGVGPLYLYDTSLRLGAKLNIFPTDVYLQAGAAKGARKLLPNVRGRTLSPTQFPAPFSTLPAHELENLLCWYRRYL
jgi:hypothetical protein